MCRKAKRTFNEPGHAHFITYSCQGRFPLLTKDRARQWVIDAIRAARQRHDLAVLAYVIMPEHVHILLFPRQPEYRMERILTDFKRPVSWQAKQYLIQSSQTEWLGRLTIREGSQEVFRFWLAGGGFDKNITTSKSLPEIARYIHDNPVRRGLVASATDWIWSSARFWEGVRPFPLEMDPLPE
jgi:putative transposase